MWVGCHRVEESDECDQPMYIALLASVSSRCETPLWLRTDTHARR